MTLCREQITDRLNAVKLLLDRAMLCHEGSPSVRRDPESRDHALCGIDMLLDPILAGMLPAAKDDPYVWTTCCERLMYASGVRDGQCAECAADDAAHQEEMRQLRAGGVR